MKTKFHELIFLKIRNVSKNKFTLAVLLFAAQIVLAQIPSNGLIAYFPFNGNANDQSGNGNNGTPSSGYIYANTPPVLTADRNSVANSAYDFQPGVLCYNG